MGVELVIASPASPRKVQIGMHTCIIAITRRALFSLFCGSLRLCVFVSAVEPTLTKFD